MPSHMLFLWLIHLEYKVSYVRLLFLDFSSTFNMIIPQILIHELKLLQILKILNLIAHRRLVRNPGTLICIGGVAVEVISKYLQYLGIDIKNDLTWNTISGSLIKKAHQRIYFLRRHKQAGLGTTVITSFNLCVVESILTSCFTGDTETALLQTGRLCSGQLSLHRRSSKLSTGTQSHTEDLKFTMRVLELR